MNTTIKNKEECGYTILAVPFRHIVLRKHLFDDNHSKEIKFVRILESNTKKQKNTKALLFLCELDIILQDDTVIEVYTEDRKLVNLLMPYCPKVDIRIDYRKERGLL